MRASRETVAAGAVEELQWEHAVRLLTTADEVSLACHVDPDGDALGSMLALARVLEQRGVRTVAGFGVGAGADNEPLDLPAQYAFLPGIERLVPPSGFPSAPPLLVTLDCASPDRLGTLRPIAEAAHNVIVIDHHATGEAFGDVRLLDGSAAATAVLVEELIRRLGADIDRAVAMCLYVALVTDTGRFQYASTTPQVLELAARLVSFDIDHPAINRRVWETHSFGYLKVLGRALERARLVDDAGLTWTVVYQRDLADLQVSLNEIEGVIDVLRAAETAECALVCKEQANGTWKASMRSKGAVDVGQLVKSLGGGGHAFAAGFTAGGALDDVVDRVADLLRAEARRPAGG